MVKWLTFYIIVEAMEQGKQSIAPQLEKRHGRRYIKPRGHKLRRKTLSN